MKPFRPKPGGATAAYLLALLLCIGSAWAGYEFPIVATERAEVQPAISGDLLVWAQADAAWGYRIWGRDLATGTDFPISSVEVNSTAPDVEGEQVAWLGAYWSGPDEPGLDIYGKDLSTGDEVAICTVPGDQFGAVASADLIAWTDHRCRLESPPDTDYTADIYGYDLVLRKEVPIAVVPDHTEYQPSISGDRIVWVDSINPGQIKGARIVRDLSSGELTFEPFAVPTNPSLYKNCPVISGDIVVWLEYTDGTYMRADVRGVDLRTGEEFPISTAPGMAPQDYTEIGVDISGNIVVWEDWRNNPGGPRQPPGNMDIYGYDLSTGVEFPVCTAPDVQMRPRVSGNLIVWEDYRNTPRTGDVYGYQLNASATPSGAAVSTTVGDVTVVFDSVEGPGATTVDVLSGPSAPLPLGLQLIGGCYQITTTAQTAGTITVKFHYEDADVPSGQEESISLLWWDGEEWVDTTVRPVDTTNNIVTGECAHLSAFVLVIPGPVFSDAGDDCWARSEIEACARAGIVQGYDDGSYHPAEPVNRAQMAVYMARSLAGGDSGVPATPSTVSFPDDVPAAHWAYRYVEYAVAEGVVQGYDPTHYGPDIVVTRDQMAVFVARAKGWVSLGEALDTAPELFSDVPAGFWSGVAVEACVDHGVVNGYSDGTYHPEREVTRDQMAVYVARAFELAM